MYTFDKTTNCKACRMFLRWVPCPARSRPPRAPGAAPSCIRSAQRPEASAALGPRDPGERPVCVGPADLRCLGSSGEGRRWSRGPVTGASEPGRDRQRGGRHQAVRLGGGPGGSGAGLASREGGRPGGSGLTSPPALPWRRGTFYQGYLCTKCGVGAHKECLEVTPPCKISEYRPRPACGA